MKHYTIVGNWKMHQNPEQAVRLVERLQKQAQPHTHVTNVICPPFVDLPAVKEVVEEDLLKLGAQNLHEQDEGTFTGEISGTMLKGLVDYVIVGHSERRRFAHETDKLIGLKLAAAVRNGLKPILCVGDRLHDREEGSARRVVVDQLNGALSQITDKDLEHILIAYEPVWAISTGDGKGHFASPTDVEPMVTAIRNTVEELFGERASSQVEVLYGGSVNPEDAKAYLELDNIAGLLVGGASLNYEQFAKIIAIAGQLADAR